MLAADAGHVQAAKDWIAPCDPTADDLESDSAYRVAYASIGTASSDPAMVFAALGDDREAIPVDAPMAVAVGVLRANAFELAGDVNRAAFELCALLAAPHFMTTPCRLFVQEQRAVQICARSLPLAEQVLQAENPNHEVVLRRYRRGRGRLRNLVVAFVATFIAAFATGLFFVAYAQASSRADQAALPGRHGVAVSRPSPAGLQIMLLLLAGCIAAAVFFGWRAWSARRGDRRLAASGPPARAIVLDNGDLDTEKRHRSYKSPLLDFSQWHELVVLAPGRDLYKATAAGGNAREGVIDVRVDPNHPASVAISTRRR